MNIAYSCVVDARPKYEWQAFLWAHSLLRNGKCRPEDLKIHCTASVSGYFRDAMYKIGISVIPIQPFEGGHVYCNKIQQCFSSAFHGYDKVVLTDTDMFFLAPPTVPTGSPFAAMPVRIANPPLAILRAIYDEAHIPCPEEILVGCALSHDEKTFRSNLNGGYYVADVSLLSELGQSWKKHALWLIERIQMLGSFKAHVDQVALALALDELRIDLAVLTSQSNFSMNVNEKRLEAILTSEAISRIDVVHYHSCMLPGGALTLTNVAVVDEAIERANQDIAAIINDSHDNYLFWSFRYSCFPETGSGVGSRGGILAYKKKLLEKVVPLFYGRSVLEVGCGDLETSREFPFKQYAGYDLSPEALNIARKKRPDWRFVQGSITGLADCPRADLVICLDVLIHQKKKEDYQALVKVLSEAAGHRLIVSGYDKKPSDEFASTITAFHEPLSLTLRNFGLFNEIMEIGSYRDVSMIVADKAPSGSDLHPNDIPREIFNAMVPLIERRDLLRMIMDASRENLGFFTQTSSRTIEYPWIVERLMEGTVGSRILDIGAGVSPLPIILARRGMFVDCVDAHPRIRTLETRQEWNEWGFIDYSVFSDGLQSYHASILDFQPKENFDAIYSISVLEHMPRVVWERTLDLARTWLKPDGMLLLTLDLIPGTFALWNKSEGRTVDGDGNHGLLKDISDKLKGLGFVFEEFIAKQNIPYSKTDVAFLKCRLKQRVRSFSHMSTVNILQAMNKGHNDASPERACPLTSGESGKKNLFLHIGTPKTGTSSLQEFLHENYDRLMQKGILYPKSILADTSDPKHQPFFAAIHSGSRNGFDALLQRMKSEMTNSVHSIVISSEGFYHHLNEFSDKSRRFIYELARHYHLQVVAYVRPQADYIESMHRQYLKNPRGVNAEFGSGMTIYELLSRPKILQNMDYYDSLMKWADAAGENNIIARRYSHDILADFLSVIKADIGYSKKPDVRNISLTREMAELLRQVNPSLDKHKRDILIDRMEQYLGHHPGIQDKTFLSPEERSALMDKYRDGNNMLAKKWLHEEELFPESALRIDNDWAPLHADRDTMMSFLNRLCDIAAA